MVPVRVGNRASRPTALDALIDLAARCLSGVATTPRSGTFGREQQRARQRSSGRDGRGSPLPFDVARVIILPSKGQCAPALGACGFRPSPASLRSFSVVLEQQGECLFAEGLNRCVVPERQHPQPLVKGGIHVDRDALLPTPAGRGHVPGPDSLVRIGLSRTACRVSNVARTWVGFHRCPREPPGDRPRLSLQCRRRVLAAPANRSLPCRRMDDGLTCPPANILASR